MIFHIGVEWVVAKTRFERTCNANVNPAELVDRTAAAPLDPYTDGGLSSSVGIDATKPFGVEFPEVSEVPGWREFDLPEIAKQ